MDATTLRLILAVIGAVFLIGLYLWEKQRAEGAAGPKPRRRPTPRRRQEPDLGPLDGQSEDDTDALVYGRGYDADGYGRAQAPEQPEAQPAGDDYNAYDDYDDAPAPQPAAEPAAGAGGEILVQLYITTADDAFRGEEILEAAEGCKLRPGDMDIFHRTRGDTADGEPLFSMANLVKPGTFPFDDMTGFSSPGLAVFAQFRGEPSDLMVFDEMLDGVRDMAEMLGGEVRGPRREPLGDADAKALRDRVRALLQGEAP